MALPLTPAYWLIRAEDVRSQAEEMSDGARETMLLIAAGYERMARYAAELERLKLPIERADVDPSG